MAYRSSNVQNTAGTSIVVTAPAGIVNGDILIAWGATDGTVHTYTWPSGFTELADLETTIDGQTFGVAYKKAASESGNYTIGCDADCIGGVAAFSGRDGTLYLHRSSTSIDNTSDGEPMPIIGAAFGSATSGVCDILLLAGIDVDNSPTGLTFSMESSGLTERAYAHDSGFRQTVLCSANDVGSGATGALTITASDPGNVRTSTRAVVMIALLTAAVPEFNGRWQLEDGSGNWQLEDGSGYWVGETFVESATVGFPFVRRDRRIVPLI